MKKLIFLLLTLALILALVPAGMAKKPAPSLSCTTEYVFRGGEGIFDSEGRLLGWQGTISGDIEGVIQWWMVWPPKFVGQTNHFESRFEIWDIDPELYPDDAILLLAGYDAGTTTSRHGKNSVWRANGTVTEAIPEFEDWIGRQVHEEGHFTWAAPGVPDQGDGTFRVN